MLYCLPAATRLVRRRHASASAAQPSAGAVNGSRTVPTPSFDLPRRRLVTPAEAGVEAVGVRGALRADERRTERRQRNAS